MLISLATSTTTITISAQLAWGIHCQVNEQHLFILNVRIQEAQKQRQLSELVRVHNKKKRRANHGHKWKKWTHERYGRIHEYSRCSLWSTELSREVLTSINLGRCLSYDETTRLYI